MAATAQKFHSRAPRYILEAEQSEMRFASMNSKGQAYETQLVDISETGLAFEVATDEAPTYALDEGDMLKVQFTPPGSKTIACFATVIRMDFKETWHPEFGNRHSTKIAVQFRNLPTMHLKTLQHSLGRMTSHDDEQMQENSSKLKAVSLFAAAIGALCAFLYATTLPTNFWHSLF